MIEEIISPGVFVEVATVGVKRIAWAKANGLIHLNKEAGTAEKYGQDLIGAIGEYVACKHLNAFWDSKPRIDPKTNTIDKNDIPGYTRPIDVKTRIRKNPDWALVSANNTPKRCRGFDFIFCSYWDFKVKILGYMPAEEYFDKAEFRKLMPTHINKTWVLDVSQLYNFEEFVLLDKRQLLK